MRYDLVTKDIYDLVQVVKRSYGAELTDSEALDFALRLKQIEKLDHIDTRISRLEDAINLRY